MGPKLRIIWALILKYDLGKIAIFLKLTGYPYGERGKEIEFHNGRSFVIFQTFPPILLGLFDSGDLVEGRFSKIQLHCGLDSVRMCMFLCSTFLCIQTFVSSVMLSLLIVGVVECVMDAKVYIWLLQSVSRSMDLILLLDARQHRQLDFIFRLFPSVGRHPFHFGWNLKKILFFQNSVGRRMCSSSWKT